MEIQLNSLRKMVNDLIEQNKSLKAKITSLEDEILKIRAQYKFYLNKSATKGKNFNVIQEFIDSTNNKLSIITPYVDSTFVNFFIKINKLKDVNIQIILHDRQMIPNDRDDLLKGFDELQLNSLITKIYNSDSKMTILIQDDRRILICSTNLSKKDILETYNFIIVVEDPFLIERFKSQYEEQLPHFMRTGTF
ncbi:MAG: phospholipase D-like domain-containing protein [Candidatus Helarchaeota archaeon]